MSLTRRAALTSKLSSFGHAAIVASVIAVLRAVKLLSSFVYPHTPLSPTSPPQRRLLTAPRAKPEPIGLVGGLGLIMGLLGVRGGLQLGLRKPEPVT